MSPLDSCHTIDHPPNVNCIHYDQYTGRCNLKDRKKFLWWKIRPMCNIVYDETCDMQENFKPNDTPPPPPYHPPANNSECRGRCGCRYSSMPPK